MTTTPDLSEYDATASPEAYEWWLSDHPWAVAERIRRHAATLQAELDQAAKVHAWIERTQAADAAGDLADRPDGWRDNLVGLAETMAPVVADNRLRAAVESAEPDDLRVLRLRHKLESKRRVEGDWDYTYPQHLVGPGAAAYRPPGWTAETR
jgi:hypothetical protein